MSLRPLAVALAFIGTLLPCPAQPAPGTEKKRQKSEAEPVFPIFTGIVRELTRSRLILEVDGGNNMEFRILKSTRFYEGATVVKTPKLKAGDQAAVECRHAPDASLDAVNVRTPSGTRPPP